jgi:superfamily II DNA or RNA helicase
MDSLHVTKLNEVYIKVDCERNIAQEVSDFFTFFVPGYQFMKPYKDRLWDGKIRLFDLRKNVLFYGLLPYLQKFCDERKYKIQLDSDVSLTENFSLIEAEKFIENLNLPKQLEKRDYQVSSFVHAVRNKRVLLLSPTSSGKSFILYLILRYIQQDHKKGLLIVPRTSLAEQMYSDFASYGYDSEKYCHRQYAGKEKTTDKFLTITTWQSIYKNPPEYFEQFDFVLGDEAHEFKAKSLTTIMSSLINTNYRIGCTGTLDGTHTHKLVLEGLFGPVLTVTTTKELMDDKHVADFSIKCLILKYPEETCKMARKWNYNEEIDYIVTNPYRNTFIKNLVLSLKGNSLVLFNLVEKHGRQLFRMIEEEKGKRKVFFVYGGTDVDVRESIRAITEKENDAIIVASYGTFSTGINIRNLHNVIFASPSKSRVRNLQSIGRGLRKGDNKTEAVLYDISDDFRTGKFTNFTLKHFVERVNIYDSEKFKYKFYNVELKNG